MLTIRKANREDIPLIAQFNRDMARETEGIDLPAERILGGVAAIFDRPSRGQYWLCLEDGRAVGQLMVTYEWSDWRNADFWWIQSVYTIPSARGRGVYRRLHETVIREATAAGACGIRLYVERHNAAARAVYEKLGMRAAPYEMLEIDFVVKR
jgi:GNAT superfamily N-acetyltransferase